MSKPISATFAQLLGLRPKSKRAEDDDDKPGDEKGRRAEGDDGDEKDKGAKGGKAEGDEKKEDGSVDGKRAEDDDGDSDDNRADDEEDDDAAEDGSEDDGDEKKDEKSKKAAAAERRRCARIIAHGIKCGNVRQAGVFAFDTGMSSASAISALNAAGAATERHPKAASLRERMAEVPARNAGAASGSAAQKSLADQIVEAGRIRRGEQ